MVYRLRNKNLFMTVYGYKNNYHPVELISSRITYPETTFCLKQRSDHHSFLRGRLEVKKLTRPTETSADT